MVKVTETSYECKICKVKSEQLSHHKSHLKTKKHKDKRMKLIEKLENMDLEDLEQEYGFDNIDDIIDDLETQKIVKEKLGDSPTREWENITTSDALRETIHEIHNFLRNNGAGYGMNALKVFNLFYGLKRIEDAGIFDKTGLDEVCKFSHLYSIAKRSGKDNTANENLISTIRRDVMKNIYENERMKKFLFYILPEIKPAIYAELIKKIQAISDVEERCGEHLSGKIYEYFIGRDQTAISELGAYFTNRRIVNFIYSQLDIELEEDGTVPEMIDPFGGSGGFTIAYINYMNQKYDDIDWQKNLKKIHHCDMNEDVVKSAALEFFCITGHFPGDNFGFLNSFTNEFRDRKYKYIITNPPYGGDKNTKTSHQEKRDKLKKYIEKGLKDDTFDEEEIDDVKEQLALIRKDEKADKKRFEHQKVSVQTSSSRVKKFCKKYELKGNDKEAVSLIQFMDMLDEGGTCCGVLKEGVFFNKTYKDIRKVLVENFNVKKVISVDSKQFENTGTKTSIVIFENTGSTKKVEFRNLIFEKTEDDVFEIIDGKVTLTKCKDDILDVYSELISSASGEEILENEICSLNGKDYNRVEMIPGDGYVLVRLGDICEFYKYKSLKATLEGKDNFYTCSDKIKSCNNGNLEGEFIIMGSRGTITEAIHYYDGIFGCGNNMFIFNSEKVSTKFIYYILTKIKTNIEKLITLSVIPMISKSRLQTLQIPIPKSKKKIKEWTDKISEQFELKNKYSMKIEKLEKKIRDRILEITEQEKCEEVELGDICQYKKGGKRSTKEGNKTGKYPLFSSATDISYWLDEYDYNEKCVIINTINGSGKFNAHISDKFCATSNTLIFSVEDLTTYTYYFIIVFIEVINKLSNGSGKKKVGKDVMKKFKIKIPKDKTLIEDMKPLFEKAERYQKIEKEASERFNQLLEELRKESIKE